MAVVAVKALGLFQWHLESWLIVRRHMGLSTADLRADPKASTEAAMYAMGEMGLYRWWSTYQQAKANTTPRRESILGARLRRVQARYEGG